VQLAGFSEAEANKLFGRIKTEVISGLSLVLRPPLEVREAFTKRHETLLEQL